VNTPRSPRKATNWDGIENSKSSRELWLSWYQSIDKTNFPVYVKFEVGLAVPFPRKMSFKKVRFFKVSSLQTAGFENKKSELFENLNFVYCF
jgi:hypothetical protein